MQIRPRTVAPRSGVRGLKWGLQLHFRYSQTEVAPRSGVRGLKFAGKDAMSGLLAVAPRSGVRGLKCFLGKLGSVVPRRTPLRGAWIEIAFSAAAMASSVSHPAQGCVD